MDILLGNHQLVDFPTSRRVITDTLAAGKKLHHVAALLEFDMAEPRAKIARHKAEGRDVSFTAWIVSVVGKLLGDNKEINCYRQGFSKVVVFDDADVSIVVERNVDGRKQPLPYVVRKANEKDCFSITREIRKAQSESLEGGNLVLGDSKMPARVMNAWLHLPGFVRGLFWDYLRHDGKLAKKTMGTAVVTSIGMFGKFPGWAIPIGLHTVELAIGGSYRRPAEVDGKIEPESTKSSELDGVDGGPRARVKGASAARIEVREFLRVTMLIDHDLVDGAPAARVIDQLTGMMERGWGLD